MFNSADSLASISVTSRWPHTLQTAGGLVAGISFLLLGMPSLILPTPSPSLSAIAPIAVSLGCALLGIAWCALVKRGQPGAVATVGCFAVAMVSADLVASGSGGSGLGIVGAYVTFAIGQAIASKAVRVAAICVCSMILLALSAPPDTAGLALALSYVGLGILSLLVAFTRPEQVDRA